MSQTIKWTKDCRLGLDDIDTQHRLLFAIAGEVDEINNPDEQGPEIKYLVNHIRYYVKEHFAYEEAFMDKINYPEAEKHKETHGKIVEEINHTLTKSKNLTDLMAQIKFLMTIWIKEHILEMDQRYAKWYKENIQK